MSQIWYSCSRPVGDSIRSAGNSGGICERTAPRRHTNDSFRARFTFRGISRQRHGRRGVHRLSQVGRDVVWRPNRPSRLFPARIGHPAAMARRNNLCRPRRALPVPAGPGVKPGRLLPRRVARQWTPRRLGGVAGLHLALGSDHVCFRARRGTFHRPGRGGLFAWAETRRGRRGRPSRVGHDEKPDAGSAARRNRPGGRCDRRRVRRLLCSSCARLRLAPAPGFSLSKRGCDGLGTSEFSGHAMEWRRRAFPVRGCCYCCRLL